jgi:flotillin
LCRYGRERERVVVGGGSIVWPFVDECRRLSLEPKSVFVTAEGIETQSSTKVTVEGLAQVGVDRNDKMILRAAQHLLDKPQDEIEEVAAESIESRLRSEMRTMTLEAARQKQEQLAQRVADAATADLSGMGLCVESFIIRRLRER